jgi:hypothetical protein
MKPNMSIRLVEASTGKLIEVQEFYDSALGWVRDDKTRQWYIARGYGGEPLLWWLAENPKPTR